MQMPRPCRIGLELRAEVRHVDAQIVAVLDVRRPPDLAQQQPVREHLARMRDELREQPELHGRQMHRAAAARDAAVRKVDCDVAELDDRRIVPAPRTPRRSIARKRAVSSATPKGFVR